jgi:hypothetical protein
MVLAFVFSSGVIFGLFFGRGAFRFCVVGRSWTLYGSGGTGVSNVTDEFGSHMFLRWSSSCLFVWKAWCFSFSVRGRVLLGLWVGTLGTSGFDWIRLQWHATACPCLQGVRSGSGCAGCGGSVWRCVLWSGRRGGRACGTRSFRACQHLCWCFMSVCASFAGSAAFVVW